MTECYPSQQGNKQEIDDGTKTNEICHATCGCHFSRRHSLQYPDGVWIRPNDFIWFDFIWFLGVLGSIRPLPGLRPGLSIQMVDFSPPSPALRPGQFFKSTNTSQAREWAEQG